ncbi:hypothetical protein NC652_020231 [Populus alba x Populus x berolinensis]|nr:hypothetical protein NC652_020193 [Populus alba x Populus x berolinensis]KAJ6909190.1 hypothetical protein NC652_020231 [Populus alba x Populus x berolinensis]
MLGFTSLRNIAYQNYQLSASLKRLAVTRSWPLGCLPILTAFSSYQNYSETWNIASKFHNQKLQREQGMEQRSMWCAISQRMTGMKVLVSGILTSSTLLGTFRGKNYIQKKKTSSFLA